MVKMEGEEPFGPRRGLHLYWLLVGFELIEAGEGEITGSMMLHRLL